MSLPAIDIVCWHKLTSTSKLRLFKLTDNIDMYIDAV